MGYSFAGLYAGGNINVEGAKGFSSGGPDNRRSECERCDKNYGYQHYVPCALESRGSITIESKGNSINTYGQAGFISAQENVSISIDNGTSAQGFVHFK